jgi:hypothetical protein
VQDNGGIARHVRLPNGNKLNVDFYSAVVDTIAAVGTLLALVFAIRAIGQAKVARSEAARAGTISFELEIIRELQQFIEEDRKIEVLRQHPGFALEKFGIGARMAMLEGGGWYEREGDWFTHFALLRRSSSFDEYVDQWIDLTGGLGSRQRSTVSHLLSTQLIPELQREILVAIQRRHEARGMRPDEG